MSTFPNVPNLPGVPPVLRNALTSVSTIQGLVAGARTVMQFFQGQPTKPLWGIFDADGNSVIDADSFLGFDNSNESNISDFPVQNGGFATYNKVRLPARNGVRISKGGTLTDRANLLRQIDQLYASMDEFIILTPEKSYLSVNLERFTVTRKDKDAAFFLTDVDLYFREIQVTDVVFTNTPSSTANAQAPSAQPPVNQGVVQPSTPDSNTQAQVDGVLTRFGQ